MGEDDDADDDEEAAEVADTDAKVVDAVAILLSLFSRTFCSAESSSTESSEASEHTDGVGEAAAGFLVLTFGDIGEWAELNDDSPVVAAVLVVDGVFDVDGAVVAVAAAAATWCALRCAFCDGTDTLATAALALLDGRATL